MSIYGMDEKEKMLLIINPVSGTHTKERIPERATAILSPRFDVGICYTEYAGHATLLAQEAVDKKYSYVVAVGGDGTCNEVARSLIHTDTALGIIPIGSGNGLARHLSIPLNPERALQMLDTAVVESIDYCKANEKSFSVPAAWDSMRG